MAGFQITLKLFPDLEKDRRKVQVRTNKRSRVIFRRAARVFVEQLASEVQQHQDTGMSYASLFHIAKIVRANISPVSPKQTRRKGFTSIAGSYYKDRFRSQQVGLTLGEKSGKIQYGTPNSPRFNFVFEIQVYQYLIHEFGFGGKPAWQSIEKAIIAMDSYLLKNALFFVPGISDMFRDTGFGLRDPEQNPFTGEDVRI